MKSFLLVSITMCLCTVSIVAGVFQIPYMPRGDDAEHQGFIRISNLTEIAGAVEVWGVDDEGQTTPRAVFTLASLSTKGYRVSELESGAVSKGLSGAIGAGNGDWRIYFESASALKVVAYYRNPATGFLNALHDTGHAAIHGVLNILPMVNPGSNPNQLGKIRLINDRSSQVVVQIGGLDDAGVSYPLAGSVNITLAPNKALTLSMAELEQGSINPAVSGALGDGFGKWQLVFSSDTAIGVMSLIFAPNGYLSNVSSTGDYTVVEGGRFPVTCEVLDGALLFGRTNLHEYLGFLGSVGGSDSIYSDGQFGSSSGDGVLNTFSDYGSSTSDISAFNPSADFPPRILKHGRLIGSFSTNPNAIGAVHPITDLVDCNFTSLNSKFMYNPQDLLAEPSKIAPAGFQKEGVIK